MADTLDARTCAVHPAGAGAARSRMDDIQPVEKRVHLRDIIYKTLLDLIGSGNYRPGDRLPRESQLALQLGVSRTPLREALQMLESDGYLVRQQGRGTFIKESMLALEMGLETLDSMTDVIPQYRYEPGTALSEIVVERADSNKAAALGVSVAAEVCTIRRLGTADGEPLSWGWISIPRDLLERVPRAEDVAGSVLLYLERNRHRITLASAAISTVPANREIAKVLGVRPSSPLLKLDQVHYGEDGKPVALSETLYRPDVIRFKVIRRRRAGR